MRVERFQENNMQLAMAKVRSVLGRDAVLVSTRKVEGRTEVIAASDCNPEEIEAELKKMTLAKRPRGAQEPEIDHVWEVLNDDADELEQSPSLVDMQDELGRLRKLFEGELAQLSWRETAQREPNRAALIARLETAGIGRVIADKIIQKALPCRDLELGWRRVQRLLARNIKISEPDLMNEGGVIALLGSTGVGKTTTAAKIAAEFAARHGRHEVAFITTDNLRVAGQLHLISLGSSLGIPVQVAVNKDSLNRALESFSERKLVIIDTAGINQRNASLVEQITSLSREDERIRSYVVLSATAQESVISETIKAFSSANLNGAVITKLDECSSIGQVFSGLIRYKLPAAYIGTGQRLSEDLERASADVFVSKIVESYNQSRSQTKKRKLEVENNSIALL